MSLRAAVQNKIESIFKDALVPSVVYDANGARQHSQLVRCRDIIVQEEGCDFVIDPRQGRERAIKPLNWTVKSVVHYSHEVDLHDFVMDKFRVEILVPATETVPSFRLRPSRYSVQHPVRNQPAQGSSAQFDFIVEATRGR